MPTARRSRAALVSLLVLYVLGLAAIVFAPVPDVATATVAWVHDLLVQAGAPVWVSARMVEFVLNAAMFVPLTFLGMLLVPTSPWRWVLGALVASTCIELVQLGFLSQRSASVVDVAANSLGGAIGALAAEALLSRHRRS